MMKNTWELYDEENSCYGNCKHYIEEYQQYDNHCSNKQAWDVSENLNYIYIDRFWIPLKP